MREKTKTIGYIGMTILLFGLFLFCMSMTVWGGEDDTHQKEAQRLDASESVYLKELRHDLAQSGYNNCGITMTKIYMEDGSVDYTVLLHHLAFDELNEEENSQLTSQLQNLSPEGVNCKIMYQFNE